VDVSLLAAIVSRRRGGGPHGDEAGLSFRLQEEPSPRVGPGGGGGLGSASSLLTGAVGWEDREAPPVGRTGVKRCHGRGGGRRWRR
jgi:hypothetical protein